MFLAILILLSPISAWCIETHLSAFHPEWVVQSRQLIGESKDKRQRALEVLRARFPSAEDVLKEVKGEYRAYALDVLVALAHPEAVEKMLPHLDRDPDGALTLAVNALLSNDNHQLIAERYGQLLTPPLTTLSTPQIVAMVDFFTHLKRPCSDTICAALLKHPRLEVQQAAALHLTVTPKSDRLDFLKRHLAELYPQVRAQVLMAFYQANKNDAEEICQKDRDPIVQSACDGLTFAKPPPKKKAELKKKAKTKKDKKKDPKKTTKPKAKKESKK